jgi:dipeptidyl aminopeptidase/acylaminoacyl peptidase
MSFGAYEAGGAAAWSWLGFQAGDAALCMFAVHVCSQAVDYSLGAAGMILLTLVGLRRTPAASVAARPRRVRRAWAAAALLLAACAAAFLALEQRRLRKAGALKPPEAGREVPHKHGTSLAGAPEGFVAWSSNRSGNHNIWRMDLPGGRLTQVTRHPHAETYPRISPDGRRIVFARSKIPWVSQRDELGWDVYVVELGDGGEQLVAAGAAAPSWVDDGRVVYQLGGTQVVEKALGTGATRVLCAGGAGNIPGGTRLQTPHFNPRDGKVAATLRGASRQAAVVAVGANEAQRAGDGCQLSWSPDFSFLYDVDRGGRMRNAIRRIDPATLAGALWFDMPEPYSHEYFPKLSPDGRWLAFGAAAKGHEHDTADYEIFLWKTGAPPESALRLTWHTGNDCWPDVWVGTVPAASR